MSQPIELYYWPTPNGRKITIMLEETGLPYRVVPVDITGGAQFETAFLAVSPNNKVPAILDPEGVGGKPFSLFESGAILIYLAEKSSRLMPTDPAARYRVLEWLMFQMGNVGPMLGQAHHFRQYAPEAIDYAINRYTNEAHRIYNVLEHRLALTDYVAGDYSIADIAIYPWLTTYERQGQRLEDFPNLRRWYERVGTRPAVQRGMEVMRDQQVSASMDERARENLFGAHQYTQQPAN
jgi:GST-like protein